MSHPLISIYNTTRAKYLKLKARYDKTGHNWTTANRKRKRHLVKQLRKLYNRLLDLQARFKVGAGIAALSVTLAVTEPADAQSLGPFVKQPRSENPLRHPVSRHDDDVFAAVDIDNDGDLDLAIGHATFIRFFMNNGTPEKPLFDEVDALNGPFSTLDLGAEHYDFQPAFADLDEDGDMDMVLDTNQALYYCRNDNGKFFVVPDEPWVHTPGVPGATGNPLHNFPLIAYNLAPHFADYDSDGDLDLILGHDAYSEPGFDGYYSVSVWRNEDNASFDLLPFEENPFFTEDAWHIHSVTPRFADVDNDGDLDLLVGHNGIEASPGILTLRNNEGDYEPDYNFNPFLFYDYNTAIEFADFDNDGDLDALARGSDPFDSDQQSFSYFENNGDFTFTQKEDLQNPFGGVPRIARGEEAIFVKPVFIDVDNDGDLDLFVCHTDGDKYGGRVTFYRYDENTADYVREDTDVEFAEGLPTGITPVGVDWDTDGDTDILMGADGGGLYLYINEGNNQWSSVPNMLDDIVFSPILVSPAFLDADLDGDLDAFMGFFAGGVHYYRNDSVDPANPIFVELTDADNPFNFLVGAPGVPMISTGDVNGDGYDDLIYTIFSPAEVRVYLFSPGAEGETGTFALMDNAENPFSGLTGNSISSIQYIDVDGDGDRDVFTGSFAPDDQKGAVNLLLNENPAPIYSPTSSQVAATAGVEILIDPNAVLSDPDNDVIFSATITLVDYEPGNEILFVPDPPAGISIVFTDGVLYITGPATVATYQGILREVTYFYDQDGGQRAQARSFDRTVNIHVYDADGTISTTSAGTITLSHINDAPVLNPPANVVTYSNAPVTLHGTITTTDTDDPNFVSAEVTFLSGFDNTQDVLSFTDAFGITGNFNPATGILTLTGDRPIADYQNALRTIQYNNSLGAGASLGPRQVLFKVYDGEHYSNDVFVAVLVAGNSPTINSPVSSTPFTGTSVVINNNLTITDADDTHLESATVSINAGFQASQDQLDFTNTANISGSYNATTGVLTLTGTATLAEYETALESVAYTNSNASPAKQTRVISFQANDGTSTGNTISVGVVYPNTPPVIGPASASATLTGMNVVLNPALTITDDDANLQAAVVSFESGYVQGEDELVFANQNGITGTFNAPNGTLTLLGSSSVANYQAALRSILYRNIVADKTSGARVVHFIVNDGTVDGNVSAVTVNVSNNPPVLVSSTTSQNYVSGDQVADGNIVVSDTDNSALASATVVISSGFQSGQDELLFTSQNGITGTYDGTTGTLSLSGTATVANYQDALRSVQFRNGNATNRIGGPRTISFTVNDGGSNSNTISVTMNVQSIAPVISTASDVFYISGEMVINSGITVTDSDNTTLQSASVVITSGLQTGEDNLLFANQNGITGSYNAATGTLTMTGNSPVASYQAALRTVRYSNSSNQPNTDDRIISFSVNDGSNAVTLAGNIVRLNKPPQIAIEPQQTSASGNIAFPTGTTLTDPDDNLDLTTLTVVSAQGANIIIDGGLVTISYANLPNYKGVDEITITVCDAGGRCNTSIFTIEVGAEPVVYNGMSPNRDGVNDFFFIQFVPLGTHVTVLNRWGDIIFETDNYDNDDPAKRFEGKNKNGTDVIDGTYFYSIRFQSGQERKGSLLIKR